MMPLLMRPGLDRALDRAGCADPIDGPHVQAVPTLGGLAGVAHAQRGAEDGRLDVVHRHGVSGEHRLDVAVPDEPLEISTRPGVNQGGPGHPDEVPPLSLFLTEPRSQLLVIDRTLAADFGGHEPEFVGPMDVAQKALGVHHDPLGAVLGLAHGDQVAALQPPGLDRLELAWPLDHHAVHPGPDRRQPLAVDLDVGGQVRGREEALWQDAVGRERSKAGLRRPGKRGLAEIG